jgi:hypothetical protein
MKQQTAVEWLESQLNIWQAIADEDTNATLDVVRGWIDKLKAMEKEQIMMAVKDSWYMAKGSNFQDPQEEQYYNETYNK